MSLHRVLAENALPGAAALVAAAFAYMLTGGEEEYPHSHLDTGEKDSTNMEDSKLPSESESAMDRIETQLRLFGERLDSLEKTKPEWASELQDLSRSIASDVSLIKASLPLGSASPVRHEATVPESLSSPVASAPTLAESTVVLCDSIWAFAAGLPSEIQASALSILQATDEGPVDLPKQPDEDDREVDKRLQAGCDVLLMFVRNLIKFPTVARYRRLMISNPSFATSLAPCPSHDKVLLALGFVRKEGMWEQDVPTNTEMRGQLMRIGQGLLEAAKHGRRALVEAMRPLLCPPIGAASAKGAGGVAETTGEHEDGLSGEGGLEGTARKRGIVVEGGAVDADASTTPR